jgi:hypothetical protein
MRIGFMVDEMGGEGCLVTMIHSRLGSLGKNRQSSDSGASRSESNVYGALGLIYA